MTAPATLSADERRRIDVLSDGALYNEAVAFAHKHSEIDTKQLTGLLVFSRSWSDLLRYVNHQAGRDWVNRDEYREFYQELRRYLDQAPKNGLLQRVRTEFQLVPEQAKQDAQGRDPTFWATLLAQEFIQHLFAEAQLWKRGGRN